jgi:hypothetical protein
MRRGFCLLVVFLFFSSCIPYLLPTPVSIPPVTKIKWGLCTTTFQTPQGKIKMHLPDDLACGDTISGSVIAEPSGKDAKERQKNMDELSGYVIQAEGITISVAKGVFKWVVPTTAAVCRFILKDKKGKKITKADVSVNPKPPSMPHKYHFPQVAQWGRPVEICGPFNGNFKDTSLKVANKQARFLAESPRKAIFESPHSVVGRTTFGMSEQGEVMEGEFNIVRILLKAPKTTLVKGEKTTLNISVEGLQGLPKNAYPLFIKLSNMSPGVINFGEVKGNTVVHEIQADEVKSGGTYQFTLSVIAISPGHFDITAKVLATGCGAKKHTYLIGKVSKKRCRKRGCDKKHQVEWDERCFEGTCRLRQGHEGTHRYSYKRCDIHEDKKHVECFKTKEKRDARYRKLKKESRKRKEKM